MEDQLIEKPTKTITRKRRLLRYLLFPVAILGWILGWLLIFFIDSGQRESRSGGNIRGRHYISNDSWRRRSKKEKGRDAVASAPVSLFRRLRRKNKT